MAEEEQQPYQIQITEEVVDESTFQVKKVVEVEENTLKDNKKRKLKSNTNTKGKQVWKKCNDEDGGVEVVPRRWERKKVKIKTLEGEPREHSKVCVCAFIDILYTVEKIEWRIRTC